MSRRDAHTDATAFVPPLPGKLAPGRGAKSRKRACRCARAAADAPRSSGGEPEPSLAQRRATLENALDLQLEAAPGKSGECACIWCNGTSQRRCSWCEGRGVRYELGHASWEQLASDIERMASEVEPQPLKMPQRVPVRCSACGGSRKLRCAYCRGSGVGSYGHAH